VKFDKTGKFIKAWGKKGMGHGEFDVPHTVAFDSRGRLLVGDRQNNRIQILTRTERSSPSGDQLTVHESIRFTSPGILEDRTTVTDPKALLEPFTQVRTYRKASPPNDELREFSCAEGLKSAK
jgi:hypothetical protein